MDEAVGALGSDLGPRVALVALGGYGRQALCPGSDVDLMVLHAERRPARIRETAEQVFYPFWDAGITLGHAVRTVRQSLDLSAKRLDAATALIDARLVAGDEGLFQKLRAGVWKRVRKDLSGFLEGLAQAIERRGAEYGSCSQLLEPDVKEGLGGLRDIDTIRWAGWAVTGSSDFTTLGVEGLLRLREARGIDDAEEFLFRVRTALHLEVGRRSDRVFFDYQPTLARQFGFEESETLTSPDALMATLFEHARGVEHVRELALDRASARTRSRPRIELEVHPPRSAEDVLRAFATMAREGTPLSPGALDTVENVRLGEPPYVWTDDGLRAFLNILEAGPRGSQALEAMDQAGLLVGFLPDWAPVRCRPQRDPYHRFTVDVHLLRTAAEAALLLRGESDDPLARESAGLVYDRSALLLGALLHDIGKTGEGEHVPRGSRIARGVLERMGVPEETRELAVFLVAEHLLLANTATRRDLGDENLVLDVASRVGDPERLAMLYLLTLADGRSTGPHAWTPWRQALVRELVAKVEHVFERGEMGPAQAETLADRIDAIRRALGKEDPAHVERYLERAPRAYVLAVDPERAAENYHLLEPELDATEVRITNHPGRRPATHDVTILAHDRPGLLAKIAGALSLSGLNILTAEAFTTEDGVAIDLFGVEAAFKGEIDEERWDRVRADLRKAIEGKLSLEYRVREKRRSYPPPLSDVEPEVRVDNEASDFFTVVEVSAPDRIGLLFELARAFEELGLDVHLAKVATYGGRVVDSFYVRDLFGEKIEDTDHRREVERALLALLAET
ncbi:MAG: bifunctional uridylyltransferase/uridylyl-removing protein GlnD [Actinomycetota bacterium]